MLSFRLDGIDYIICPIVLKGYPNYLRLEAFKEEYGTLYILLILAMELFEIKAFLPGIHFNWVTFFEIIERLYNEIGASVETNALTITLMELMSDFDVTKIVMRLPLNT